MNQLSIIISLSFILFSCSKIKPKVDIPKNLIESKIPELQTQEWRELYDYSKKIKVKIIDNKLDIKEENIKTVEQLKEGEKVFLEINKGTLKGTNRGEVGWNGKLLFIPNNKEEKEIEIKKGKIQHLFKFKGKTYFIEGHTHYSGSYGSIFELKRDGKNFSYEKVIEFDDEPEAFTIFEDKLLIATEMGSFYVIKDFKVEVIFNEAFWVYLNPNSITVVDNENVYMGIRSGLVRLDLTNKKMVFHKLIE